MKTQTNPTASKEAIIKKITNVEPDKVYYSSGAISILRRLDEAQLRKIIDATSPLNANEFCEALNPFKK